MKGNECCWISCILLTVIFLVSSSSLAVLVRMLLGTTVYVICVYPVVLATIVMQLHLEGGRAAS